MRHNPSLPQDAGDRFLTLLRDQVQEWRQHPTGVVFHSGHCESELHAADLESLLDQRLPQVPAFDAVQSLASGFVNRLDAHGVEPHWWNKIQANLDQVNPVTAPVSGLRRRGPR